MNLSIKYAKARILHRSSMRSCDVNTDNIWVIKVSHTNVTVLCSLFRVSEQDYRDKEPARSGENSGGNGQEDIWDYDDSSVRNTVTATRPRVSMTSASIIIAAEITITTAVTTRITTATTLWLVMTTKTFYRSPREKMPRKKRSFENCAIQKLVGLRFKLIVFAWECKAPCPYVCMCVLIWRLTAVGCNCCFCCLFLQFCVILHAFGHGHTCKLWAGANTDAKFVSKFSNVELHSRRRCKFAHVILTWPYLYKIVFIWISYCKAIHWHWTSFMQCSKLHTSYTYF